MRNIFIAVLGVILLLAGIMGRPAVFYRLRGVLFSRAAVRIARIIYIAAGIFLIAVTLNEGMYLWTKK